MPLTTGRARFTRFFEASIFSTFYEKEMAFHGNFFYDISFDRMSAFWAKRLNDLMNLGSTQSFVGNRTRAAGR